MDITDFLIEKGFKIDTKTLTPKGRNRIQYSCIIDKKPEDILIKECEERYGMKILKFRFRKGRELIVLMRKEDKKKNVEKPIEENKNINLDMIIDAIHNKELSKEELTQKLTAFQNSVYIKGYNAHRNAVAKLLNVQITEMPQN